MLAQIFHDVIMLDLIKKCIIIVKKNENMYEVYTFIEWLLLYYNKIKSG